MGTKEKVYDAFAELIYSVVMADGEIKDSERIAIEHIVKEHPIKKDIQKYFASQEKNVSVAQSFLHTLEVCKEFGADQEYPFLISIIQKIAKVSEGLDNEDDGLLLDFVDNFKRRFALN